MLYVPDALAIATFPTILLLTTLFRLALNVSSSRLILLQANAGEVIRAFGTFVVRGNYVVGGVVFLILTIIQFVVIAKGGERVAEVGARFVLDAMPGKQMAIDAELRGGTIDGNEARPAPAIALAREPVLRVDRRSPSGCLRVQKMALELRTPFHIVLDSFAERFIGEHVVVGVARSWRPHASFVPARKITCASRRHLRDEYSTAELQMDSILAESRHIVVDDFVIELDFLSGREKLLPVRVETILKC